jgi:UTP--glucose-1-phosphate uridylyltransferase
MKIDRAVIVATGRDTRFLPVTGSIPKEMLPLVNKPLLSFVLKNPDYNRALRQLLKQLP